MSEEAGGGGLQHGGGGAGMEELDFMDFSEVILPLDSGDISILHSVQKPSSLPLPGAGGVWLTPSKSPECEFGFGEATAILKSLQLNPNAAVFTIPSDKSTPAASASAAASAANHVKKLNAASAPFIPSIPIPLPTTQHAQTIHINNLTANLNYHVMAAADNTPVVTSAEGGGVPVQPIPFTMNGSFSGYVHPFQQNQNYKADGYQSPVVVYQEPNINQVFIPMFSTGEKPADPPQGQQQQQQESKRGDPEITFGSNPPVVSVKGKLYGEDEQARRAPDPSSRDGDSRKNSLSYEAPAAAVYPTQTPPPTHQSPVPAQFQAPHPFQQQFQVFTPSQIGARAQQQLPTSLPMPPVLQQQPTHIQQQQPILIQQQQQPPIIQQRRNSQQLYQPQQPQQRLIPQQAQVQQQHRPVQQQHIAQHRPVQQQIQQPSQQQQPPQQIQHSQVIQQQPQPQIQQVQQQLNYQQQPKPTQQQPQNIQQQPQPVQQSQQQHQPTQHTQQQHQPTQHTQQQHQPSQHTQQQHQPQQVIQKKEVPQQHVQQQAYKQQPDQQHKQHNVAEQQQPQPPRVPQPMGDAHATPQQMAAQHPTPQPMGKQQQQPPPQPMAAEQPTPQPMGAQQPTPVQQSADNVPNTNISGQSQVGPEIPGSAGKQQQQQEPAANTKHGEPEPASAGPKSWAGLFKAPATSEPAPKPVKPTARISPFTSSEATAPAPGGTVVPEGADNKSKELGRYLKEYKLTHFSASLLPCGLVNRSNWCFVNAILQALLACPPLFNLLKNFPLVPGMTSKPLAPMMESLILFMREFQPLQTISKPLKKDKGRKKEEVRTGVCIEPSYVYKMLLNLSSDTFKVVEGRQEDAEEFLTCLLNGVSDEMLALIKLVAQEGDGVPQQEDEEEEEGRDEGDDWQEVDSRGKGCVTRRVADPDAAPSTPIQSMALGISRSSLKSASGEGSATLQPFFTLPLDIQHPEVNSINQALVKSFDSEEIDGYICQKTKQVVEASRSTSLEELPAILILHIKRFVYDGSTRGVQKVMKPVDFTVDMEIPKSVLSAEARPKFSAKQRLYKLFAVVYHNGREATKGHYVTDVYHTGYSSWLHCDDATITETGEQSVLNPSQTSTPYILFYRRCDTMVGLDKSAEKAK